MSICGAGISEERGARTIVRYCGTVDPMEIRASESRKVGAPNLCDIDIDGLNRLTQTSTLLGRKGRGKRGNVSSFPLFY